MKRTWHRQIHIWIDVTWHLQKLIIILSQADADLSRNGKVKVCTKSFKLEWKKSIKSWSRVLFSTTVDFEWNFTDWCCFFCVNSNPFISIKQRQFPCSAQHVWVEQKKSISFANCVMEIQGFFFAYFRFSRAQIVQGTSQTIASIYMVGCRVSSSINILQKLNSSRVTRKQIKCNKVILKIHYCTNVILHVHLDPSSLLCLHSIRLCWHRALKLLEINQNEN